VYKRRAHFELQFSCVWPLDLLLFKQRHQEQERWFRTDFHYPSGGRRYFCSLLLLLRKEVPRNRLIIQPQKP
jgi:hypothetical protein